MSLSVSPLAIGNAMRAIVAPPAGSLTTRLLRKLTNDISDQNDPNAVLVYDGIDTTIYDANALVNGTLYYYQSFYLQGNNSWQADAMISATPGVSPSLFDGSVDAQTIVTNRITVGIANEVTAGRLVPSQGNTSIRIASAPVVEQDTDFPFVTVRQKLESPSEHGIGESIMSDVFDPETCNWEETDGWFANTEIEVVGWTLNADVRIAMRKALRRIVLGNLQIFNSYGMAQIEFSQSDVDDFVTYESPIYSTVGILRCQVPLIVGDEIPPVKEVTASATTYTQVNLSGA